MATMAYSGNTGDFVNFSILEKTTLNFFDVKANSNKYYTIEIHEGKNNSYRVFTEYGRIGAKGRKEERIFSSRFSATNEYESIIDAKKRKGYVEIELAQANTGTEAAKQIIDINSGVKLKNTNSKGNIQSTLDTRVQAFVKQIYYEAGYKLNMLVKGNASNVGGSPLGKLSVSQINYGRSILQQIANSINTPNGSSYCRNTLINLASEYYKYIPKYFGRKISEQDMIIADLESVATQSSILDFYESILNIDGIIYDTDNIDKQYENLCCDIIPLEKDNPEYIRIVNKVRDTESIHHNVHLSVKNIFSVNQYNAPKLYSQIGNVQELFHGTRSANMPAILSSHLKLPSKLKGVPITGAMFGPGLYFASNSTKSSQYSSAKFGGTANKCNTGYLFLVDVALGKSKEVTSSHNFLEAPAGYNSVKACKGSSLLHDEYIVYKENQQKLKYIVEFATYRR